ncbi:MAG: DUF2786 domain-containing protein [Deltaproteobacteria bacterium]|nr:DUF2786 domain-containing protein [Deltaproteobacteria bacterium]
MNGYKQTKAGISFQRAWIAELYREHESICWQYRVDLPRPIIEISQARREWGAWDARSRTLRISAHLIETHSWDITLNVFKHEMAHQIVTDLFGAADGHGILFKKACHMIGVPHKFREAGGDLPRRIRDFRDRGMASENMRMLEKVRKLLSLARSKNEHEAFLAMQKANELIEKHNIDRLAQDRASQLVYAIIHHKKKRIENYQRKICQILREHFFVDVIYSRLYDAADCQTYKTIELLGAVENVRIAEYVYHFLMHQMERLWERHRQKSLNRVAGTKRSYRLGVLKGFHDRLDREAKDRRQHYAPEADGPDTLSALICTKDPKLNAFRQMRFPRLVNYRSSGARIHYDTFQAGVTDGERVRIHKGLEKGTDTVETCSQMADDSAFLEGPRNRTNGINNSA